MLSVQCSCPFTPESGELSSEIGWEGDAPRSRQRFMGTMHARRWKGAAHEPFDFRSANVDCRLTDSMFDVESWALDVLAVGRNALPCFPRLPWFMVTIPARPWMEATHEPGDRPRRRSRPSSSKPSTEDEDERQAGGRGSWPRFASILWRFSLPMNRRREVGTASTPSRLTANRLCSAWTRWNGSLPSRVGSWFQFVRSRGWRISTNRPFVPVARSWGGCLPRLQ
jgi:hypothetical protein